MRSDQIDPMVHAAAQTIKGMHQPSPSLLKHFRKRSHLEKIVAKFVR
jgi:hypothetical protein